MTLDRPTRIAFGTFRYDFVRRELTDPQGPVRIGVRALQLLEVLLESPGRVCTREELVARVWPRTVVEESSLRVHISALRRTLGDGQDGSKYVLTVPGRGYTFVAEVKGLTTPLPAQDAQAGALRVAAMRASRPIGRGEDIARIGELLSRERLVSIVGAGGTGKTTVALAVAENVAAGVSQGVFFVDLASLSDAALVVIEVGQACGISVSRTEPWACIVEALREQQALIVLDNCEHVIDAAAMVADRILQACPQVRILATSREPLEAEAEWVFRLPPLGLPAPGSTLDVDSALTYPALRLFAERAQATSDTFQLTDTNVHVVRQLCEFLDGMPLAIELAAARVGSLGLQGLMFRLEQAVELLTRGRRTAMGRHRTLHAVLNWSYRLLGESEQRVLQRLSVFRSAFDLDAAVAVASCEALAPAQVMADVRSLQDKSLLVPEPTHDGQVLYRMLYVTRLFAEKALGTGPDEEASHHRHARLVLRRMVEANQAPGGTGPKSVNSLRTSRFASAATELRTAIGWALMDEHDLLLGIEITVESLHVYHASSRLDEYMRFIQAALDKLTRAGAQDTPLEFRLYQRVAFASGQSITTAEFRERCFRKTHELGPRFGTAADRIEALYAICTCAYGHGDYLLALNCCEEIRELAQGELAGLSIATADRLSVLCLHALGQHDAAERLAHRVIPFDPSALELRFQTDVPFGVSMRIQLARIHWLRGDFQLAWATLQLTIATDPDAHIFAKCQPLGLAAIPIALWKGDTAAAARWCHDLHDHSTRTSAPYWQAFAKVYGHLLDASIDTQGADAQVLSRSPLLAEIVATLLPGAPMPALLARVREGQVGWCAPEVLRLSALADLAPGDPGSRERCGAALRHAFELSVEQGARFWSLRITKSLFRVSAEASAERAWARDQIVSLLNAIDDGSSVPDLVEARRMVAPEGAVPLPQPGPHPDLSPASRGQ